MKNIKTAILIFFNDRQIVDEAKLLSYKFPDQYIFKNYRYRVEYVEKMIKFYVYLNPGLTIKLNGNKFKSEFGLKDLIEDQSNVQDFLYPIIHLTGEDIELAITHSRTQYSEEYYSFVRDPSISI